MKVIDELQFDNSAMTQRSEHFTDPSFDDAKMVDEADLCCARAGAH